MRISPFHINMGTPKDFVSVSTFERRRGTRAHVTAPKRFFDVTSRSINVANVRPIPKAHTTLCVKGVGRWGEGIKRLL